MGHFIYLFSKQTESAKQYVSVLLTDCTSVINFKYSEAYLDPQNI